jgi:hypothetical protein
MNFQKNDENKPMAALLPARALLAVAQVMTFGAKKYEPNNWKKIEDRGRYEDALLRHFFAFIDGETYDPDSGLHHLAHVACNALFLLEATLQGYGKARERVPADVTLGDGDPLVRASSAPAPHGALFDEELDQPASRQPIMAFLYDLCAGARFELDRIDYVVDHYITTVDDDLICVANRVLDGYATCLSANASVRVLDYGPDHAADL